MPVEKRPSPREGASNGKGGVLEEKRAGARWLLPVLLSCGAVLLPLVSLHQQSQPGGNASRMNASPSSLELAARLLPPRASRSAPSSSGAADLAAASVDVATTTPPPAITVVVHRATTAATAKSTTNTTVHHKSTTTTTRKSSHSTTTTTKPAAPPPSDPPQMRPFAPPTPAASTGQSETGEATWYKSSDPAICAHRTLPIGTVLTVVNLANNKTTTCRVGDRGPFVDGRIIDLSPEAFSQLAPLSDGVINVRIEW